VTALSLLLVAGGSVLGVVAVAVAVILSGGVVVVGDGVVIDIGVW